MHGRSDASAPTSPSGPIVGRGDGLAGQPSFTRDGDASPAASTVGSDAPGFSEAGPPLDEKAPATPSGALGPSPRICPWCGQWFVPAYLDGDRPAARYCSDRHRNNDWHRTERAHRLVPLMLRGVEP
jgi:hypothetical protein